MKTIDDKSLADIVIELRKLKKVGQGPQRDASWLTANELFDQLPSLRKFGDGAQLDSALCRWFLDVVDRREWPEIRPAKYPGRTTCGRLWGHFCNVGPGPSDPKVLLEDNPYPLEPLDSLISKFNSQENPPIIFLSHALNDHHFAARVRFALALHGIRSWIAEGDLYDESQNNNGRRLIEGVAASIDRCDALFILLSSFSISSAWIDTEAQSARGKGKRVATLIDASDKNVLRFFEGWKKYPKDWLNNAKGKEALRKMSERFKQGGAPPSRINKFQQGVESLLNSYTLGVPMAAYPFSESGDGPFCSFDELLSCLELNNSTCRRINGNGECCLLFGQ